MKPFRIVTAALSDDSPVYSVHGENESGRIVIDCIDAAHAEALRSTLERAVSAFEVFPKHVERFPGDTGELLDARCVLERRIVGGLIAHMIARGWSLHSVNDGEELQAVETPEEALSAVFAVDESSLRFWKPADGEVKGRGPRTLERQAWHGVLLIGGNGEDIISDWNFYADDRDGFNRDMDAFNVDAYL